MPVRFDLSAEHPHVAVVTLDRPERVNALDPAMLVELAAAWRRIAEDAKIRCAVLTGAGERAFCSGMDLRATIPAAQALARGERVDPVDFEGLRSVATATLAGFDLQTPLVCAINGHARAGGFDLMLAAEIRYAVPAATFALEEVALGLYPTGNASVLLPRQIPWVHAHELLLTAQPIDAERALFQGEGRRRRLRPHARGRGSLRRAGGAGVTVDGADQRRLQIEAGERGGADAAQPLEVHRIDALAARQRLRRGDGGA